MKHVPLSIAIALIPLLAGLVWAAETLNGAGATFPYPLYSAWAYHYGKETGLRLNYQSIGSGGGQRQITDRTVDFGASDEPLASEKLAKDNLIQFPTVIGGVVPVVNVDGVASGALKLDSASLCGIYLGDIKFWDDPLLAKINAGTKIPHDEITVVYRSDGSGTTAIFTTYLSEVCPKWKESVGAGKAVRFPVGIGGKGNEGVANYVKRLKGSIGYVEFAYAKQNKLSHARLKNRAGNFVEPGFESFADAAESADFDSKKDFYLWLINAPGQKSWGIAGATFILIAKDKTETNAKVVKFFDWAYKNGDGMARELVYVPLPASLKEKVRSYWKSHGF